MNPENSHERTFSEVTNPTITNANLHQSTELSEKIISNISVENRLAYFGGEADVYKVKFEGGKYIVKIYRQGIVPKVEILQKIKEVCSIKPKNLIQLLSYGFSSKHNCWYEILEYAPYGTLKEYIQKKTIDDIEIHNIIAEITSGIDLLHQHNVLHLDLKPENILVRSLAPPNLIIADFGVSSILSPDVTKIPTQVKGTPRYWSPEQMTGIVGKESDFWSFGLILYEIIVGKHPFQGMNQQQIMCDLATKNIEIPYTIAENYQHLLKGLLNRNIKTRWGIDEINGWLSGETISKNGNLIFQGKQFFTISDLLFAFLKDDKSWDLGNKFVNQGELLKWVEENSDFDNAIVLEEMQIESNSDLKLLNIILKFLRCPVPKSVIGKRLFHVELFQKAIEYFKMAIAEESDEINSAYLSLCEGLLRFNQGEYSASVVYFKKVPTNFSELHTIAETKQTEVLIRIVPELIKNGKLSENEQLDYYNWLLKINPSNGDAWCRKGIIHNKLGDKEDAIDDFRQAQLLAPNNNEIKQTISRLQKEAYIFR